MMPLTAMKLVASAEGQRLISTVRRLVTSEGRPPEQVLKELLDHLDKVEKVAKSTGKTVKQVEDEALALYEEKYK